MTLFLTSAAALTFATAAPPTTVPGNAAQLSQAIDRLAVVGNVLYVAAHPDDENTELLSWLIHEKKIRAAYLSLTRGEGGQNLLGPERAPLLGVIRTQELLAARQTDGAEQFFGRERDFGFSKSSEETLATWGKEAALSDVVWVIRRFQPDVIVTRFSPLPAKTHGHHTASAMLALEAFHAAADAAQFPEQLQWVKPWQAKRIVWNRGVFGQQKPDLAGFTVLDVGTYNRRLGVSMGEIAAASRSMHKSQGFGDAPERGAQNEYFKVLDGAPITSSLLDGVDFTWARVAGSDKLREQLKALRAEFNPDHPETSVARLFVCRALMQTLADNPYKAHKLEQLESVIAAAAGIYVAATSAAPTIVPSGEIKVTFEAVQRALDTLTLQEVQVGEERFALSAVLAPAQVFSVEKKARAPTILSNPFWLREAATPGLFTVSDHALRGLPEAPPLSATFVFALGGGTLQVKTPIEYSWTDPLAGERHRPLDTVPPVTVDAASAVMMFPDAHAKTLRLRVRATAGPAQGSVALQAPAGFAVSPTSMPFALHKAEEELELAFTLTPPAKLGAQDDSASGMLTVSVNGAPAHGVTRIDYPHIPVQTLTPTTEIKLVRFTQKRALTRVGYVAGAGDDVAAALRDVGYDVTMLSDQALAGGPLDSYEAIVIGVRAFNTNPRMLAYAARLQEYVHNGGVVVAQYNTQNRISEVKGEMGPYPIALGQDRVTEEAADVTFALPEHRVLLSPNRISARDFAEWTQERGLYFAATWDKQYQAPLSLHDQHEDAKLGALLVAQFGKGVFIYTGLAFFRQLPAGVPGAYRLMANLLSRGK